MPHARFEAVARSPGLLTDLYQLTMAQGYWLAGMARHEAVYHLTFRRCPFGGSFALACGIETAAEWLQRLEFTSDDLTYLGTLSSPSGGPLFDEEFLEHLGRLRFTCRVDAWPEGSVVFPYEPVLRVEGPLLEAQLVETALLCLVNFETLIATKAARVRLAAGSDTVLEFGLRRAQGADGGMAASRASFIGGCDATSNVLAGQAFGVPVAGTHAHSWVMAFDREEDAFRAYVTGQPDNATLLVDTYETIRGVERAIRVGLEMQARGERLRGIRLDSGDLAELSRKTRQLLNEAGLHETKIIASGDLDEYRITELKVAGASIDVWGVGTRLVTAADDPALGGVYKLAAIRPDSNQPWRPRIKRSDNPVKTSDPGRLEVTRQSQGGRFVGDTLWNLDVDTAGEPSLQPLFIHGDRVRSPEDAKTTRQRAAAQLAMLPDEYKRLADPETYPVTRASGLAKLKSELLEEVE